MRVMPLHDKSLRAPQSSVSYTFLWISRTLYFMIPAGISTSTTSPVCAPISAFSTGDSLEICFKAVSLCGTYDLQLDVFFEFKIVYFNLTSNADLVQIYFVLYNNFSIL